MIIKEDKGIFFSADAALGLIPVLILLLTVANTNMNCYVQSYQQKNYFQEAQDTAELMAIYVGPDDRTILEEISSVISQNPDRMKGAESARNIAEPFLKKTLGKKKYCLVEMNYLKGNVICSKGNIKTAKDVGVAVKCQGNYLYKLYVWE